jgi:cation-transporting P-type ATPase C
MTTAANGDIRIRHQTSGRVRVTVPSIKGRPEAARLLAQRLGREPQIGSADVRPTTGSVILYFDGAAARKATTIDTLATALAELDQIGWQQSQLPVRQDSGTGRPAAFGSTRRGLLRVLALTGFTLLHLIRTFILKSPLSAPWMIAGTLLGGLPLFRRAFLDATHRRYLSANSFLSGATLLATFTGESAAALEVLWIQETGQLLEDYIQDRSRRAIRDVILVSPKTAFVLVDGSEVEVPITDIRVGDILCVHNTERIPVDGSVHKGKALVDESHITGRAEPELRRVGDRVFAGTVVQQGLLHIKAEKVGSQTYLAQVARTVEEALARRAGVEKQADKLAARLVVMGTGASAVTYMLTNSLAKTLAVQLALASPCATVMAASTAVTAALANAARNQVLIKGGVYLEQFGNIDCFCFDKTGTLTDPLPAVVEVKPRTSRISRQDVLSLAAAAQCHSTHPIAKTLVQAAPVDDRLKVDAMSCETILGRGVKASFGRTTVTVGNLALMKAESIDAAFFNAAAAKFERNGCTAVYVARNGKLQGLIGLTYDFRPGSLDALQRLRREDEPQIHLVSGDSHEVVVRTARNLGMTSVRGDMLPEDKADFVARLESDGRKVAMVGDGINDAPALARATIGVAMGAGGAQAAIEAADIALVDNRLERIVFTRRLSHRTLQIIKQNHWFAVSTDLLGAILAIAGILPPLLSGATHIVHTLTIAANSSRIFSYQPVEFDAVSHSK